MSCVCSLDTGKASKLLRKLRGIMVHYAKEFWFPVLGTRHAADNQPYRARGDSNKMDQLSQITWASHEQTGKCNGRVGRSHGVAAAVHGPFQITTMKAGAHERCAL